MTNPTGNWTRDGGSIVNVSSTDLLNYSYDGGSGTRYMEYTAWNATAGTCTIAWSGTYAGSPVSQTLVWDGTKFNGDSGFSLTPPSGFACVGTFTGVADIYFAWDGSKFVDEAGVASTTTGSASGTAPGMRGLPSPPRVRAPESPCESRCESPRPIRRAG